MKKRKSLVLALASLAGLLMRGKPLLANEAPATTRGAEHWKRKTAMAIGKPELANAADDDLDKAHDDHMAQIHSFLANDEDDGGDDTMVDNSQVEIDAALANAATEHATALAAAQKETDDAKAALKAERVIRSGILIGNAIAEARLTPAMREDWEARFANDFAATETALGAEKKKLKTTPLTAGLGQKSTVAMANAAERSKTLEGLVALEMPLCGNNREEAFSRVQKNPANATLFASMQDPLRPITA